MTLLKMTKTELRAQQLRLAQLEKYLPTLQLKKAMLQVEVSLARQEVQELERSYKKLRQDSESYSALLTLKTVVDPMKAVVIKDLNKKYENIAGIDVPTLTEVNYEDFEYSLIETPAWFDGVVEGLRALTTVRLKIQVAIEKKNLLEDELRQVSIRVNLFEKILIPRAKTNIKKIKIFLSDQQLAAVSQAKVAKAIVDEKKQALIHAH